MRSSSMLSSCRLDVRRVGALKNGEQVVGNRTRVKVVKNKMAAPFREVEFDILYGQGVSKSGDLLDLASESGIVEKSGSWFSYKGERIGQGREQAKLYLEEHPETLSRIEIEVLAKNGITKRVPVPATANGAKAENGKTETATKADKDAEHPPRKERPAAKN